MTYPPLSLKCCEVDWRHGSSKCMQSKHEALSSNPSTTVKISKMELGTLKDDLFSILVLPFYLL
jgi:hypothetical protein